MSRRDISILGLSLFGDGYRFNDFCCKSTRRELMEVYGLTSEELDLVMDYVVTMELIDEYAEVL